VDVEHIMKPIFEQKALRAGFNKVRPVDFAEDACEDVQGEGD